MFIVASFCCSSIVSSLNTHHTLCTLWWELTTATACVCVCVRAYIHVVVRTNSCKNVVLRGCGTLWGSISYFLATRSSQMNFEVANYVDPNISKILVCRCCEVEHIARFGFRLSHIMIKRVFVCRTYQHSVAWWGRLARPAHGMLSCGNHQLLLHCGLQSPTTQRRCYGIDMLYVMCARRVVKSVHLEISDCVS